MSDERPTTLTIDLAEPIQVGGGAKITEITIREPTLGQFEKASQARGQVAQVIALIAQTGGISEQAARNIPLSKLAEVADFFAGFLPGGQEIGGA